MKKIEDAIQDHVHADNGHTYRDTGHVHKFDKELPPDWNYGDFILRHGGGFDSQVCNAHCNDDLYWKTLLLQRNWILKLTAHQKLEELKEEEWRMKHEDCLDHKSLLIIK